MTHIAPPANSRECSSCGIQLNADGTVDELDYDDPQGHYANCSKGDPCICGATEPKDETSAAHWRTPFSAQNVAFSCSEACGDIIESARDEHGVLTLLSVNGLRKHCPSCKVGLNPDGTVKGTKQDVHRSDCTARFVAVGTHTDCSRIDFASHHNHYGPARDDRAQRQAMAGKRIAWKIETIA
jgi:hypothetical protein